VSEETGTISVAENGKLVRSLTVEGLESLLMEALGKQLLPTSRGNVISRRATREAEEAAEAREGQGRAA